MKKQIHFDKAKTQKTLKIIVLFSGITILLFSSFFYFNFISLNGFLIVMLAIIFLSLFTALRYYVILKTKIPAIELTSEHIVLTDFNALGIRQTNTINYDDISYLGNDIVDDGESKIELLSITLKNNKNISYNLKQHGIHVQELLDLIYELNPKIKLVNYGTLSYK